MTNTVSSPALARFRVLEQSARALNLALRDIGERWREARNVLAQHQAYRDRLMRDRHAAYAGRNAVGPGGVMPRGDAAAEHQRAVERTDAAIADAEAEVARLAGEQRALEARWQSEAALVERCRQHLLAVGALRGPLREGGRIILGAE